MAEPATDSNNPPQDPPQDPNNTPANPPQDPPQDPNNTPANPPQDPPADPPQDPDLLGDQDPPADPPADPPQDPPADPNAPRAVETLQDGSWRDQFGNVHPPEPADPNRPEWLPEKFKTPEDMAEAYKNLEKKLGERGPEHKVPEQYDLKIPEGLNMQEVDEEDQKFFRENGFSNEQAQAFLDYVGEGLVPQIQQATTEAQMERLGRQWDMDPSGEAFKQRLGELKKWADENLPESVVNDLRKSANGVSAMFQMMQGKMSFASEGDASSQGITQAEIDSMVTDPRYGKDEAYTQYVEQQVRQANREN